MLLLAGLYIQTLRHDRQRLGKEVIASQLLIKEQAWQIERERAASEERQIRFNAQENKNHEFDKYFDIACALEPEFKALVDVELSDGLYEWMCGRPVQPVLPDAGQ